MGPTNQCKLVASSHVSSHNRFESSSTLDALVFPSRAGLKNLAASSRDSGEKEKGLGSRLNTPEGSCNPTMLKPSTISSKREVSGHPISKAIFFKRQILLGRKMASTPFSMLSFSARSSSSSSLAHPIHLFRVAVLRLAISAGPNVRTSRMTLSISSGTAWYRSNGCWSCIASSSHCLGLL